MKKILLAGILLIFTDLLYAQPGTKEDEVIAEHFSGHLFDGISGIMVYSLYQNNNYLMQLYTTKNISKDSAFDMSLHQMRASEYVLNLINTKILEQSSSGSLKGADVKYLRNLKAALIVISGQARNLNEYIEGGGTESLKKFNLNRNSARRMVNLILNKE